MYCLIEFCCICVYNRGYLQPLSDSDSDNITYFMKLTCCVPEMCYNQMNDQRLVCNKCRETIDAVYKFRQRCLRSKTTLIDYISQLHKVSNISGTATVYLTDINKINDTKKENLKENNINKNEMFIKLDADFNKKKHSENNHVTEIKREVSLFNSKLMDTKNYIQFENVMVKMEHENQFFQVNVEESVDDPLINQDENKTDVSQNAISMASVIKKENENQGIEEHLQERFENILEAYDIENEDRKTKVEENFDYSLNSEKYSDVPLINVDEIKADIEDHDIELVKSEINIQYKSEDIEEFTTEDNVIPLEDQNEDKTDKEMKFFHKILKVKQKQTALSKNVKQKKCDVVNRKDKIVKKHESSICKKNFSHSSSLNSHIRINTEEKMNECDVCQKKFTQASSLMRHKRIHSEEKSHACDVCQKKFNQSSYLRKHMKIHTGEKPHECDVCQKKFTYSTNLMYHKRIHTGEKTHECDVCRKKFTQSSTLKAHLKIHTGVKTHECSVCQKKFIHSFHLTDHKRIHSGEKPHECNVCRKKFTHLSALVLHKKIHSGEKPYACSLCQKKFSQSANLRRHMRIHTGVKSNE